MNLDINSKSPVNLDIDSKSSVNLDIETLNEIKLDKSEMYFDKKFRQTKNLLVRKKYPPGRDKLVHIPEHDETIVDISVVLVLALHVRVLFEGHPGAFVAMFGQQLLLQYGLQVPHKCLALSNCV